MAACRVCRTELDDGVVGCTRCMPVFDLGVFDILERNPRWAEAQHKRVGSRAGNWLLVIGAVFFLVALMYTDQRGVFIGVTVFAALFVAGGLVFYLAPIHRYAAVVLTTTWSESKDSKGRTNRYYYVHLRTRSQSCVLSATEALVGELAPGNRVIGFGRFKQLDAVWPLDVKLERSLPVAPIAPVAEPPVTVKPVAPIAGDPFANIDPAVVDRAPAIALPPSVYVGAIIWAVAAGFVFFLPMMAEAMGDSDPVDSAEAAAERMRIIKIVTTLIAAGMLGLAGWLALRARKRPIEKKLIVILDRRPMRFGSKVITMVDIVEPGGTTSTVSAKGGVPGAIGIPLVAYFVDGTVVDTRPAA